MRTKDTGKVFLTVEGDPRKLSAVVVQEPGRQADTLSCGNIGKGRVMICAVEAVDPAGGYQSVLNSPQRVGRAAAHHLSPAVKILFVDQVF